MITRIDTSRRIVSGIFNPEQNYMDFASTVRALMEEWTHQVVSGHTRETVGQVIGCVIHEETQLIDLDFRIVSDARATWRDLLMGTINDFDFAVKDSTQKVVGDVAWFSDFHIHWMSLKARTVTTDVLLDRVWQLEQRVAVLESASHPSP